MKKLEITIHVNDEGFVIKNIKPTSPKNILLIKNIEEKLRNNERTL